MCFCISASRCRLRRRASVNAVESAGVWCGGAGEFEACPVGYQERHSEKEDRSAYCKYTDIRPQPVHQPSQLTLELLVLPAYFLEDERNLGGQVVDLVDELAEQGSCIFLRHVCCVSAAVLCCCSRLAIALMLYAASVCPLSWNVLAWSRAGRGASNPPGPRAACAVCTCSPLNLCS